MSEKTDRPLQLGRLHEQWEEYVAPWIDDLMNVDRVWRGEAAEYIPFVRHAFYAGAAVALEAARSGQMQRCADDIDAFRRADGKALDRQNDAIKEMLKAFIPGDE